MFLEGKRGKAAYSQKEDEVQTGCMNTEGKHLF